MKGSYDFSVKIRPDLDHPGRMLVDSRCVLMSSKHKGYVLNSSWNCDLANGPKIIEDSLVAACKWLDTCVKDKWLDAF